MRPLLIGCFLWGVLVDSIFSYYVRVEGGSFLTARACAWYATFLMTSIAIIVLLVTRFWFRKEGYTYRQAPEFLYGTTALWGSFIPYYQTWESLVIIGACGLCIFITRARLFVAVSITAMVVAIVLPYKLVVFPQEDPSVRDYCWSLTIFVIAVVVSGCAARKAFVPRRGPEWWRELL